MIGVKARFQSSPIRMLLEITMGFTDTAEEYSEPAVLNWVLEGYKRPQLMSEMVMQGFYMMA